MSTRRVRIVVCHCELARQNSADSAVEIGIEGCGDNDALYATNVPTDIDEDAREEYWCVIRRKPNLKSHTRT